MQAFLDHLRSMPVKRELPVQEGIDGDLVGGVEHAGHGATRLVRHARPAARQRKVSMSGSYRNVKAAPTVAKIDTGGRELSQRWG